jgi:hypothetical protein
MICVRACHSALTSDVPYDSDAEKLNVMVVYLDAVSRRQLHRKMPETVSFLEEIYAGTWHNNVSSVFQFFNYHAIGPITKLNMRGAS